MKMLLPALARISQLLLCLALLLTPEALAFAGSATLALSPASGTFNPGCSFTTDILVDTGGADTDGTDAIIFYDATRLNATSITNGTIYSDYPGNSIDPQSGKITVSGLASVSQAFKGSGKLATINFTVVDKAPAGSTQLKFDFDPNNKTKTTDSNVVERGTVADVLNSVTNATYTIGTGTDCASGASTKGGIGGTTGGSTSTSSASPAPGKGGGKLPGAGNSQATVLFAGVGGLLTVLGILGLALL